MALTSAVMAIATIVRNNGVVQVMGSALKRRMSAKEQETSVLRIKEIQDQSVKILTGKDKAVSWISYGVLGLVQDNVLSAIRFVMGSMTALTDLMSRCVGFL